MTANFLGLSSDRGWILADRADVPPASPLQSASPWAGETPARPFADLEPRAPCA